MMASICRCTSAEFAAVARDSVSPSGGGGAVGEITRLSRSLEGGVLSPLGRWWLRCGRRGCSSWASDEVDGP